MNYEKEYYCCDMKYKNPLLSGDESIDKNIGLIKNKVSIEEFRRFNSTNYAIINNNDFIKNELSPLEYINFIKNGKYPFYIIEVPYNNYGYHEFDNAFEDTILFNVCHINNYIQKLKIDSKENNVLYINELYKLREGGENYFYEPMPNFFELIALLEDLDYLIGYNPDSRNKYFIYFKKKTYHYNKENEKVYIVYSFYIKDTEIHGSFDIFNSFYGHNNPILIRPECL